MIFLPAEIPHFKRPERATMKKDIVSAAESGDRKETLISLRDLLAERLANTKSGRDAASLSLRLMDCLREIDELKGRKADKDQETTINNMRGLFMGNAK